MRTIIISDEDARALLEQLELEKLKGGRWNGQPPTTLDAMHRTFHYIVCRWLQEQGANVVR